MKFALILFSLAALCTLTAGQIGAQVYCGRRLAQTLAYWCQELEEGAVKRSDAVGVMSESGWRWSGLGGARGKRGVVEECCEKACTLDVLLTYC